MSRRRCICEEQIESRFVVHQFSLLLHGHTTHRPFQIGAFHRQNRLRCEGGHASTHPKRILIGAGMHEYLSTPETETEAEHQYTIYRSKKSPPECTGGHVNND